MIPVRVPADAVTHVVTSGRTVPADYSMDSMDCPVCDLPLSGLPVSLVYVGTPPADRGRAYVTGAAVAVHDECTVPDGGEAARPPACDPGHVLYGTGDLALALGGCESSFTGQLLRLAAKADPTNRRRLALAFPRRVRAYELWQAAGTPLTAGELLAAIDDPNR